MDISSFQRNITRFNSFELQRKVSEIITNYQRNPKNLVLQIDNENYDENTFEELKRLPLSEIVFVNVNVIEIQKVIEFTKGISKVVITNPHFNLNEEFEIFWDASQNKEIIISGVKNSTKKRLTFKFSSANDQGKKISITNGSIDCKATYFFESLVFDDFIIDNHAELHELEVYISESQIQNFCVDKVHGSTFNILKSNVINLKFHDVAKLTFSLISSGKAERFIFKSISGDLMFIGNNVKDFTLSANNRTNFSCTKFNTEEFKVSGNFDQFFCKKLDAKVIRFSSGEVVSASFAESKISDCRIDATFLSELLFRQVVFEKAPSFLKDGLCLNSHFINCKFKDFSHDSISKYRNLKNHFNNTNNDLDEILFSSLELQSRALTLKFFDDFVSWICAYGYWAFNSFGRSVSQPVITMFVMWLCFSVLYFLFFDVEIFFEKYTVLQVQIYWGEFIFRKDFYRCMLFSFFNSLGPLRYLLNMDFLYIQDIQGKALIFFQNILSSINLYILIVGIKKRFKQS